MTVTQTVDIPANRRLTIDVPKEVPAGKTVLIFKPVSDASSRVKTQEDIDRNFNNTSGINPLEAIDRCSGIAKRLGCPLSNDVFLAMRRLDKELEYRLDASGKDEQRHNL